MNLAVLVPACAATVNLTSGIILVAISRAPGWRMARVSAFIAFTAALYCLTAVPFGVAGLDPHVYLAVAHVTYVAAALHALAWLVFAFGGPDASLGLVPRPIRWLMAAHLAATVFFTVTGAHLRHEVTVVDVAWFGVQYRYPVATLAGDLYGFSIPAIVALVLWQLWRRVRAGERDFHWHLVAFVIFLACAVDEALVANRVIVFLSMVGFGFVAIVTPLTVSMTRRVIGDARRLAELSAHLEDEVRARTAERDRAESALAESERLAALGRLAAGVGHEINNPLTYTQLAFEDVRRHLDEGPAPTEVRQAAADAIDGARRIQKVVEGLRSYSSRDEDRHPLDLRDVARSALKVAWPRLRHVAQVTTEFGNAPLVEGDEARLVQALVNLLSNAAQALDGRREGRVVVSTTTDEDGRARVSVRDDGPGVPAAMLVKLAEPYFTTRAGAGGLGLGLFLTQGTAAAHGGRLVFESEEGRGLTASIVLPPASRDAVVPLAAGGEVPSPPPASEPAAFSLASSEGRVLLVDDEPLVLRMLAKSLGRSWIVTSASGGAEALEILERADFDAIVCDLMMPGVDGMDVAAAVAERRPALRERMLFLTGGAVVPAAEAFLARPDVRHMTKPVSMRALSEALRDLVGKSAAAEGD